MPITGSNDRIIVNITVNYFDCHLSLNTRKFTDYSRIISLCGRHFKIINYGLATMLASSHVMIFIRSWHRLPKQKVSAPSLISTGTFLLTFTIFYTHCFAIY